MAQLQEPPIVTGDAATGGSRVRPPRRRGLLVWLPIVVVVSLVALLVVALLRPMADNVLSTYNRPATDFKLQLYNGRVLDTRSLRGKTVVINFWWSGCPPCKQEAPLLEQAWRKWQRKNVVFVGVDEQDVSTPADFLRQYGITYPNGKDPNYVNIEYGTTGFPETAFISPRGLLKFKYTAPFPDEATLDHWITEASA